MESKDIIRTGIITIFAFALFKLCIHYYGFQKVAEFFIVWLIAINFNKWFSK